MDLQNKLNELIEVKTSPCITISIPTLKVGDYEKNRIRWKNAASKVENLCEEKGIDCKDIIEEINKLESDSNFWAHQGHGLVGYFSNHKKEIIKLNHEVIPLLDVSETFNLYPIISEIQSYSSIYIFCISKNATRLFEVSSGDITEVDISQNVVKDIDEAINIDDDTKSLQHHSIGGGDAYFHGNDSTDGRDDIRTKQYLRRADDGLMEVIQGKNIPLVLACVEEYYPIYKEITAYNHLLEKIIAGNPDHLEPHQLLEEANCILTELLGNKVRNFFERYNENTTEAIQFESLEELSQAIKFKNVDSLLVNESQLINLSEEERNKITRDVVQASRTGANIICIMDAESNLPIMGIKRFSVESSVI